MGSPESECQGSRVGRMRAAAANVAAVLGTDWHMWLLPTAPRLPLPPAGTGGRDGRDSAEDAPRQRNQVEDDGTRQLKQHH